MSSNASKLLMLGLRGSGKTTYLAALWHYLESEEIKGPLSLQELQPDREYLNAIRNSWLAFKPVARTSMRTTNDVSLVVMDNLTQKKVGVSLPDLSGEVFWAQWATRKAPKYYVSLAKQATGLFLFIHPANVQRTHAIKAERGDDLEIDEAQSAIAPASNWTAEKSSTQVQLVDILQLVARLQDSKEKLKVAVVISAWDTVKARSPASWLDRRLPLLAQYLRANCDWLDAETYGISAQGGDLAQDREKLLANVAASSRCYAVKEDEVEKVAITAPLQFLLR